MKEPTRERASQLFSALSHPSRLRIAELLCDVWSRTEKDAGSEAGMSVGDISEALSLGQSPTSQYLAALTRAGALVVKQKGTSRLYQIRGPRIRRILQLIEEFCEVHELYGNSEEALGTEKDPEAA